MSDLSDQLSPVNQLDPSELVPSDLPTSTSIPRVLLLWLTFGLAGAVLFTTTYLIEYGGPRCQDTKWVQIRATLLLFNDALILNGLRSCLAKNTLRQEFGNQVPGEGAPDYKI
jgi:hypothetical protein